MATMITELVALGVLPLGLALVVYLTARELLLWPPLEAKLWGAAVAIVFLVIGSVLCTRFLAAADGKREPREVGQFLARLTSLHALSVLAAAACYFLVGWAGPSYHEWFCHVGAVLGGGLGYLVFSWVFFAETDPHRGGQRVLQKGELARIALRREMKDDGKSLFFAGHWLPFEDAVDHFLVMGATNTGKTLIQRMLMQTALRNVGKGLDQRAVVFDAKQDVLSILAGMNLQCRVVTLDPFDARGYAWDMAKDIITRLDAQTLAENLVPPDPRASQKFFDDTVRSLYEEVIVTFQKTAPGAWTFGDVIYTLRSRKRLYHVLGHTTEGQELLELAFGNEETTQNIISTLNTRTGRYRAIASHWRWAKNEGRALSLTDWLSDEYVLVLGNSHTARPAIQAINQVLFTRLKELILDQAGSKTRRNWIFLDEVRQAGRLEALTSLMVEGRSRGAAVVLGFQDVEGMRAVHTAYLANEIIGQAHNRCVTKLINPDTAELFSKMIGEHEVIEKDESITHGPQGRSRTVSAKRVRRPAAMPSEIMGIAMPSPETGLTFFAITTSLGVYRETMPGKVVASLLMPPNEDPARGGMPNRVPVSADREELRPWTEADYVRLNLSPPANVQAPAVTVAAAIKPPENKPGATPSPQQGQTQKKFRVVVRRPSSP